jgi:hypothetical protein
MVLHRSDNLCRDDSCFGQGWRGHSDHLHLTTLVGRRPTSETAFAGARETRAVPTSNAGLHRCWQLRWWWRGWGVRRGACDDNVKREVERVSMCAVDLRNAASAHAFIVKLCAVVEPLDALEHLVLAQRAVGLVEQPRIDAVDVEKVRASEHSNVFLVVERLEADGAHVLVAFLELVSVWRADVKENGWGCGLRSAVRVSEVK